MYGNITRHDDKIIKRANENGEVHYAADRPLYSSDEMKMLKNLGCLHPDEEHRVQRIKDI